MSHPGSFSFVVWLSVHTSSIVYGLPRVPTRFYKDFTSSTRFYCAVSTVIVVTTATTVTCVNTVTTVCIACNPFGHPLGWTRPSDRWDKVVH